MPFRRKVGSTQLVCSSTLDWKAEAGAWFRGWGWAKARACARTHCNHHQIYHAGASPVSGAISACEQLAIVSRLCQLASRLAPNISPILDLAAPAATVTAVAPDAPIIILPLYDQWLAYAGQMNLLCARRSLTWTHQLHRSVVSWLWAAHAIGQISETAATQ